MSSSTQRPEEVAIVELPTLSAPSRIQTIVGRQSALSTDVQEFRGIPYGCVPARWEHSSLRTCLPQDIFDATHNGPKCPQPTEHNNSVSYQSYLEFPLDVTESEFDCLNLFVVRPSQTALSKLGSPDSNRKLPVLIWIHGGGFGFGAGTDPMWDPTRLVLRSISIGKPIIAVGINYRLNIFGFAASTDIITAQSGASMRGCNFGLHDQKVAIRWVSKNIIFFGGDPEKITLAGQSAGGTSVHTHTLEAEFSQIIPLFRRSVIQSGAIGCVGPIALGLADLQWGALCQFWGIEEKSPREKIEMLRRVPAAALLKAGRDLGWTIYPPVTDEETIMSAKNGIGIKVAMGGLDGGHQNEDESRRLTIDVMLGDTEDEFFVDKIKSFEELRLIFEKAYPSIMASNEILAAYKLVPDAPLPVLHDRLTRFLSDVLFCYPSHQARNFFASFRQSKGILHSSVQSYRVKFGNPFPGRFKGVAHHCVDLIYLFNAFHDELKKVDEVDELSSVHSTDAESARKSLDVPARNMIQKTNIELAHEIQDRWIQFIFDDDVSRTSGQLDGVDQISVYRSDRIMRIENLIHDAEWVEQRKRFEILEKHRDAMRVVARELMSF
ncbi:hypothetical protein V501_01939 [Pseudogymnoascus sp. VKM F-4519 (FW-2642)]|nr:hypothetical protein V501_01939 [Pseudogymnoascus sp. VKM F-4519 (FW-2642)]